MKPEVPPIGQPWDQNPSACTLCGRGTQRNGYLGLMPEGWRWACSPCAQGKMVEAWSFRFRRTSSQDPWVRAPGFRVREAQPRPKGKRTRLRASMAQPLTQAFTFKEEP